MIYSSPKLKSAADVSNLRPVVREIGSSVISVVQIGALPDDQAEL